MKMNTDAWQAVQALFEAALEKPSSERDHYLREHARSSEERLLVAKMLAANDEIDSDAPAAVDYLEGLEQEFDDQLSGKRFGPYEVRAMIGQGGMGAVYRAQREDQDIRQSVALKVIRPTRLSDETRRRFQMERKVLARLSHPNIARLIDFGTVANQPYYAMDFVPGDPITGYCDMQKLAVPDRIRLLMQVCQAVAHAHRNLVVHRDLKPSNVLVAEDGIPKLVDFGIAKPINPFEQLAPGDETQTINRFISPHFAAPEMLTGGTVNTASDVYSLGALLYELLAGVTPFSFESASVAEMERVILHEEPARPSDRVAALESETASDIAASRALGSQASLTSRLAGDLDNIILRSLAKNPERRYESVDALREDLERHLQNLPVLARPDTLTYRTGKYLRRHRFGIAMTALLVAALIGASAVLFWQRNQARADQVRAEEVTRVLVDTFNLADPTRSLGATITARDLLERGTRRVRNNVDDPGSRAALFHALAEAHMGIGAFDEAQALAQEALSLREDSAQEAESLIQNSRIASAMGSLADSQALAKRAVKLQPDSLDALLSLAVAESNNGNQQAAEASLMNAIEQVEQSGLEDLPSLLVFHEYAQQLRRQRDFSESRNYYSRAIEMARTTLADNDPRLAASLRGLGIVERELGNHGSAEQLTREALAIYQDVYGEEHPRVGSAWSSLGNILEREERFDEARDAHLESLKLTERFYGADSVRSAMAHFNLGRIERYGRNDLNSAERHFARAVEISEKAETGYNALFFKLGWGSTLTEVGRLQEAERLLREVYQKAYSEDSGSLLAGYSGSELAEVLKRQCRIDEAREVISVAYNILSAELEEPDNALSIARERFEELEKPQDCNLGG